MKGEKLRPILFSALAGGVAGLANGFFGGGGGMLLVPLLGRCCRLDGRKVFATSIAIILPLCAFSSALYFLRGQLDFMEALPYLVGGFFGGILGGKWLTRCNTDWLRRAFGLLMLYGGAKSLFF